MTESVEKTENEKSKTKRNGGRSEVQVGCKLRCRGRQGREGNPSKRGVRAGGSGGGAGTLG